MNVDTASFFCLSILSLGLFYSHRSLVWRQAVLLGTSAAFVASFFSSAADAIPLLAYLIAIFGSIYLVSWKRTLMSLWTGIVLLVTAFLVLKNYVTLATWQESTWVTVGISYIMFRAIHVLIDTYDGSLSREQLRPLDLSLYLTSLFTFAAGPIQRYDDFYEQLQTLPQQRLQAVDISSLCGRIVKGLVKAVAIAPLFLGVHYQFLTGANSSAIDFSVSAISFLAYLYLNFSGSMDIIIGLAGFYGFTLPENFDRPYLARNFLDLWNRWHITLSTYFKIYVFFPFIRAFQSVPKLGQYPFLAGVIGFFIVFFLLGIWHGNSLSYVLYGLLLGSAAAINKGWEQWRVRTRRPPLFKAGSKRQYLLQIAASAATLAYLSLALVTAWPSVSSLGEMLTVYANPSHVILAFLLMTAILCLSRAILEGLISRLPNRPSSPWFYPVAVSLGLAIILLLKTNGQDELSSLNFYQRF